MKATTEQLVSALRVLSIEIQSEDGVANAVVAEAADRLTLMANLVARHVQETKDDIEQMAVASETMVEATAKIQNLRDRIKRLEESLRQIANQDYRGNRSTESQIAFNALKEDKP